MRRLGRLWAFLGLSSLAACGTHPGAPGDGTTQAPLQVVPPDNSRNGTGTMTGSVQGNPMNPQSASFAMTSINGQNYLIVSIADQADECRLLTARTRRSNSNNLLMVLYVVDQAAQARPLALGDYSIYGDTTTFNGAGGYGEADFDRLVDKCVAALSTTANTAQSGTVTLTTFTATSVEGTYTLNVGAQNDPIAGQFSARLCPGLSAAAASSSAPTCQ
jgi:hypothetical protein